MSFCFEYDFQKWTLLSLGLIAATLIVGLVLIHGGHGQTNNNNSEENENAARTYLSCYDATMSTFL
ncbi:MAG: hypothetical protein E6K97_04955 [Thaumarchaeota archaeon]|nr:MAG: hypothetical protein E6K97_04955 [Nitrososphaerota archaeon]